MAPTTGIRDTLRVKLFDRPRPLSGKAFREAQRDLFPREEVFRRFLTAEDEQERVELAKAALASLVHTRRLSPSFSMIMNLLGYQKLVEFEATPRKGEYVARDHFVHLVNVYLLGLYLFAYYGPLHVKCTRFLNHLRRTVANRAEREGWSRALRMNTYSAFGETLSLFVLYHDLGYPLEHIPAAKRSSKALKKFLRPFELFEKSLVSELALKSMSNYLVARAALPPEESPPTLGSMFLNYISPGSLSVSSVAGKLTENDVRNQWQDAVFLPTLEGHRLRSFLTIFPDERLGAVLEHQVSGEPIALMLSRKESQLIVARPSGEKRGLPRIGREELFRTAFVECVAPRQNTHWHYFAVKPDEYFKKVESTVLGGQQDNLISLDRHFEALAESSPESPLGWGSGLGAAINAYRDFRDHLSPFYDTPTRAVASDKIEMRLEVIDRSLSSALNALPSKIGAELARFTREIARQEGVEIRDMLLTDGLEAVVGYIFGQVEKRRADLTKRMVESIGPEIEAEIEYQQALEGVRKEVEAQIAGILEVEYSEIKIARATKQRDLIQSIAGLEELKDVDEELARRGLPSLAELTSYRPGHGGENYIDHSFSAFWLMMRAVLFYQACEAALGKAIETPHEKGVTPLRLALLVDWPWAVHAFGDERQTLMKEAAVAVLLHNLYPSNLSGSARAFKNTLRDSPLTFAFLLADGLQEWDRARQQNLAESNLLEGVHGERFDVQVSGDELLISAWGPGFRIGEKDFRSTLSEYLHGVDHAIRLSFRER